MNADISGKTVNSPQDKNNSQMVPPAMERKISQPSKSHGTDKFSKEENVFLGAPKKLDVTAPGASTQSKNDKMSVFANQSQNVSQDMKQSITF